MTSSAAAQLERNYRKKRVCRDFSAAQSYRPNDSRAKARILKAPVFPTRRADREEPRSPPLRIIGVRTCVIALISPMQKRVRRVFRQSVIVALKGIRRTNRRGNDIRDHRPYGI